MARIKSGIYSTFDYLEALKPGEYESFEINDIIDGRGGITSSARYRQLGNVIVYQNRRLGAKHFKLGSSYVDGKPVAYITRIEPQPLSYSQVSRKKAKKAPETTPLARTVPAVEGVPMSSGQQLRLVELVRAHDRGEMIQVLKAGKWLDAPYPDFTMPLSLLRIKPKAPRILHVLFNRAGTEIVQTSFTPFPPGIDELCVAHFQEIPKEELDNE